MNELYNFMKANNFSEESMIIAGAIAGIPFDLGRAVAGGKKPGKATRETAKQKGEEILNKLVEMKRQEAFRDVYGYK